MRKFHPEVLSSEAGAVTSAGIDLPQNYPNPCTRETTISFSLAKPGTRRVIVCDVFGRIRRVVIDHDAAPGRPCVTRKIHVVCEAKRSVEKTEDRT